ncbi:thioredoxin family protein [Opitutus sp. ER46]|nr:thioredoxin family protein [Opitutus sp. ER46]
MKTHIKSLVLTLAASAMLAFTPARAGVEVGQPAPDFTLTDIDGQPQSLSAYRGKVVVLEWHNPDCPLVKKHYESENIPKLQQAAAADGVVWLIINSGAPGLQGADYSADALKDYLKKHHAAPAHYLRDPEGKVGHLFAAKTTPHLFIIDASGNLVYQGGIDSIPTAKKDDIARATNYVREALAAIKAGQPIKDTNTKPYGCSVKYGSKG